MKVVVMGQELSAEEVAAIPEPEPELEAYFLEPTISAKALDVASRVVPEQYWKAVGLHAWLAGRALDAFSKLPVGERVIALKRLRYEFEYVNNAPVLKNLTLLP